MFAWLIKWKHRKQGSSLVFVLLLLALFAVVGGAMVTVLTSSQRSDTVQQTQRQAYFSARSAARAMAAYIEKNPGWVSDSNIPSNGTVSGVNPGTNAGNSAQVTVSYGKKSDNTLNLQQLVIIGTAVFQGQNGKAVVNLTAGGGNNSSSSTSSGGGSSSNGVFDNLFYLKSSTTLAGASQYLGLNGTGAPISVDGDVTLEGSAGVIGNLAATGNIVVGGGATITSGSIQAGGNITNSANLSTTIGANICANGQFSMTGGAILKPYSGNYGAVIYANSIDIQTNGLTASIMKSFTNFVIHYGLVQTNILANGAFTNTGNFTGNKTISAGAVAKQIASFTKIDTSGSIQVPSVPNSHFLISWPIPWNKPQVDQVITGDGYLDGITLDGNDSIDAIIRSNTPGVPQDVHLVVKNSINIKNARVFIDTNSVRNVYIYLQGSNAGLVFGGQASMGNPIVNGTKMPNSTDVPRLFIIGDGSANQKVDLGGGSTSLHAYVYLPNGSIGLGGGAEHYKFVGSAVAGSAVGNSIASGCASLYIPLPSGTTLPAGLGGSSSSGNSTTSTASSGSSSTTWTVSQWGS